jgi:hypothetical protein
MRMTTNNRPTETGSDKLGTLGELQLSPEDAQWLDTEACRLGTSKNQLVEQAINETLASHPPGTTLPDIPQDLVSKAIRDFVSRHKGERPPEK